MIEVLRLATGKLMICVGTHCVESDSDDASIDAAVKELAELMNCPVIQTSGGTSYIQGLEDRTFQYVFSNASIEAVPRYQEELTCESCQ